MTKRNENAKEAVAEIIIIARIAESVGVDPKFLNNLNRMRPKREAVNTPASSSGNTTNLKIVIKEMEYTNPNAQIVMDLLRGTARWGKGLFNPKKMR